MAQICEDDERVNSVGVWLEGSGGAARLLPRFWEKKTFGIQSSGFCFVEDDTRDLILNLSWENGGARVCEFQ